MSEEEVFVATSFVSLETMGQLHTLERRTSSPQTKRRWSEPQITPRRISKRRFGMHHPSSDVRNRGLDHLRADGTARDPDRQPTPDGEVQASDQSCHFVFVGPPRPNTLFILKEGNHFHGIKDPITFFGKYCDFH